MRGRARLREEGKKVRHRQVKGVSDPRGVPSGSPQVDGEGRGENDAQQHQERQPGLQKPCTAGNGEELGLLSSNHGNRPFVNVEFQRGHVVRSGSSEI